MVDVPGRPGFETPALAARVLSLRTRVPFAIARQVDIPERENVWVRVQGEEGLEGWGEAAPQRYYAQSAETVLRAISAHAETHPEPARWGEPPLPDQLSASAALSAARHDLSAKQQGKPLWKLWGLEPDRSPHSSITLALGTPAEIRAQIEFWNEARTYKVKLGGENDEAVVRTIREAVPVAGLRVDANTAWTLKTARERLRMLEDYEVELVEQPLQADDLDGLASLQEMTNLPIVADESCRTLEDITRLAGRVRGGNIKLAKCGSLAEGRRMMEVARGYGMGVMVGCMIESTLGIAAAMTLAPLASWVDLDGALLLASDPFEGPSVHPDGALEFSNEPGLGVRIRETQE